jgi:WD40 repeat protein
MDVKWPMTSSAIVLIPLITVACVLPTRLHSCWHQDSYRDQKCPGEAVIVIANDHPLVFAAFCPNESSLVSCDTLGSVRFFSLIRMKTTVQLSGVVSAPPTTLSVALSGDKRTLLVSSPNDKIQLFEVVSAKSRKVMIGRSGLGTRVAVCSDGTKIATASDRAIDVWDMTKEASAINCKGHVGTVTSLAFSPHCDMLATGSNDETIKIWELSSGKELANLLGHDGAISSLAYSPNGKLLVSGSWDGTAKIWDAANYRCNKTLKGHLGIVVAVATSPDGKLLATGSNDKTIKLWSLSTGAELATLKGHDGIVTGLDFSGDSQLLVSASRDSSLRVWRVTLSAVGK